MNTETVEQADMFEEANDNKATQKGNPHSFASAVCALAPGEFITRAVEVDANTTLASLALHGSKMRERLRNATMSAVVHARKQLKHLGAEFEVEVSDLMTTKRRLYLVAIVRRIDTPNDEL